MADKPLKSITFPGLADKYMIPEIDSTLTQQGEAADAKKTGDEISGLKNTLNHKADVIYDTASGDIASFPDGADGLPVKDLTVAIEPVQSGTGDPSPTNVRPISGWTGANVTRTGKNLAPVNSWSGHSGLVSGMVLSIPANKQFTFSFVGTVDSGTNPFSFLFKFSDNTFSGWYSFSPMTTRQSKTITFEKEVVGMNYYSHNGGWAASQNITLTVTDFQIEYSDTSSAYKPYSSTTISISWQSSAGTVYGGTLDVTTGVLTVDSVEMHFDGTEDWEFYGSGSAAAYAMRLSVAWSGVSVSLRPIFNQGVGLVGADTYGNYDNFISYNGGSVVVGFRTITDVNTFKAYISDHPLQAVWKLATPQTYQLTPTEVITTLLGQNNIWTDCGPSTVEYQADTKLYIQKINTPTDDDMIADANIASGQYFIVNNNLYLSTAAILAGDPIKPGTNCTLTNLAAALNAINS